MTCFRWCAVCILYIEQCTKDIYHSEWYMYIYIYVTVYISIPISIPISLVHVNVDRCTYCVNNISIFMYGSKLCMVCNTCLAVAHCRRALLSYFAICILLFLSWYHYIAITILLSLYCYHYIAITILLSLYCYHYIAITILLSLYCYHYIAITILLSLYCYHYIAITILANSSILLP